MWVWILGRLSSLRVTLIGLIALLGGVVLAPRADWSAPVVLGVPLGVLSLNLLAAILSNTQFRRQPPLLVFHVALLGMALLLALGRLSDFSARIELSEGSTFEGVPFDVRAGWFHPGGLERLRLHNEALSIDYSAYGAIADMRNRVRWADRHGTWQSAELRIQQPLVVDGYRIYLTSGKGFSAVFQWRAAGSPETRGVVHLPAYPAHQDNQSAEWTLPGTARTVWIQLVTAAPALLSGRAARLEPPVDHYLVLRSGQERYELRSGQAVSFREGVLVYSGLRMWMGYQVFYDWTMPWLLAAASLAVFALSWHFWRKYAGGSGAA